MLPGLALGARVTMQICRSVCMQSVCYARSHLTQLAMSPSFFTPLPRGRVERLWLRLAHFLCSRHSVLSQLLCRSRKPKARAI